MRVELNVVNTTTVSDLDQLTAAVQRLSDQGLDGKANAPKERRTILFVDNFTDAQCELLYADDEYRGVTKKTVSLDLKEVVTQRNNPPRPKGGRPMPP